MSIIHPKKSFNSSTFNSGNTTFGGGVSDVVTWSEPNPSEGSRSMTENQTAGNYFFRLNAVSSAGGTITFTKVSGLDSDLFGNPSSSGGGPFIQLSATKDFENPVDSDADNVYQVTVRATSSAGGVADHTFSMTIVDEIITWNTDANANVYENENSFALDAASNSGASISYEITGGADSTQFIVSGSSLLFQGNAPGNCFSYDAPEDANADNTYVVTVNAYTSGVTADGTERTFYIAIKPVFTLTLSNLDRLAHGSNSQYFTLSAGGGAASGNIALYNGGTGALLSASDLRTSIDSALQYTAGIQYAGGATVTLVSSDSTTYVYNIFLALTSAVTYMTVGTSQLYPTIVLTEAKVTDGVTAVKDSFTVSVTDVAPHTVTLNYGSFTFANDGTTIVGTSPPSGFTTTASSGGSVTFTQDVGAPLGYTFSVSSGNGTIASQQDGVAAVSAVAEVFSIGIISGASDGNVTTSSGANLDIVSELFGAINSNPTGYSISAGGVGYNYVTYTADTAGAKTDETKSTDTSNCNLLVNTQGVDAVTEVKAYVSINVTSVPSYDVTFNTGGGAGGTATVQGAVFTAVSAPSNYTVTAGGVGNATVTFEQSTATTLGARYAMATGGSYASVSYNTDGVTEAFEVHTITPTPVNPTGGTWKPTSGNPYDGVLYNADATTIAGYINSFNMFGIPACSASGSLDAGVVTITQGSPGGPLSDTALSPSNTNLTAPAITVAIT